MDDMDIPEESESEIVLDDESQEILRQIDSSRETWVNNLERLDELVRSRLKESSVSYSTVLGGMETALANYPRWKKKVIAETRRVHELLNMDYEDDNEINNPDFLHDLLQAEKQAQVELARRLDQLSGKSQNRSERFAAELNIARVRQKQAADERQKCCNEATTYSEAMGFEICLGKDAKRNLANIRIFNLGNNGLEATVTLDTITGLVLQVIPPALNDHPIWKTFNREERLFLPKNLARVRQVAKSFFDASL